MAFKAKPKISFVEFEKIGQALPDVKPFITLGLKASNFTFGCVLLKIWSGQSNIWVISIDEKLCGSFITGFYLKEDGSKFLGMSNLGGRGAKMWIDSLIDTLSAYALENGCSAVRCYGRRGWKRIFPSNCRVIGRADNGHLLFERALS